MSKRVRLFASLILAAGLMAALPGAALARHGHHHHSWHRGYHGGYHGGWSAGFSFGWGYPYAYDPPRYYYPPTYYAPPSCGWVRMRVWRHYRWRWRRTWRCW